MLGNEPSAFSDPPLRNGKAVAHQTNGLLKANGAWLKHCQRTDNGTPLGNLANVMIALRKAARLQDLFAYDEMLRAPLVRAPIADTLGGSYPRPVRDTDVTCIQEWLQLAGLARVAKDTVHQAVDLRAAECAFHPVKEFLNTIQWDGKHRLCPSLLHPPRFAGEFAPGSGARAGALALYASAPIGTSP